MPERLMEQIKAYFKASPGIDAVYLFGSAARGEWRAKSDVDLAVLFDSRAGGKLARFDRLLTMALELESLLGRRVDLVDMREIPSVLQHQVLKCGRCIVENNPQSRVQFEVAARRHYFDMQRIYERRNRVLMQFLSGEG
ncbi:MAG: type VII toxin-antitoxin system MntA family adenylyltransferase antitoxin [Desulfurispora sp.]|uniref:type VII toxin-antitoxin system MntA family adenylyltransferase antitoxin n=1 Tax=Desulfurispora sp. TaxID=3014275 RepID=UPI00404A27F5